MVAARTMTVLFSDRVNSTASLVRLGTAREGRLREQHRADLRQAVADAGGRLVKDLGDGAMAAFEAVGPALTCAAAIQRVDHARNRREGGAPRLDRIGVATGDALPNGDDWFGVPVVEASRLCDAAEGGQVLVTEVVRSIAGSTQTFRDAGVRRLKGLPQPLHAWELVWSAPQPATRVVVADDTVVLRAGIVRLLQDAGLEVVGEAGDADGLVDLVAAVRPDVALVDLRMPPGHDDEGLQAARRIFAEHPGVGVLLFSQHLERPYADELLRAGGRAVGYLLKERVTDIDSFVDAVRRVAAGEVVLDPLFAGDA
jgi:class 3 adenylate cyclase/CheY-like chemotaxis protein